MNKQKIKFIIYTKPTLKKFKGILGTIDLYKIQILVQGNYVLEETCPKGTEPIKWYSDLLEQQDIYIKSGKVEKNTVWLEVDDKTHIDEFASWTEVSEHDELSWRTFWIPCTEGTYNECLGLWVSAKEELICQHPEMTVATVLRKCLAN